MPDQPADRQPATGDSTPPEPQDQPPPAADDDEARRRTEEREARLAELRRLRDRLRGADDRDDA